MKTNYAHQPRSEVQARYLTRPFSVGDKAELPHTRFLVEEV